MPTDIFHPIDLSFFDTQYPFIINEIAGILVFTDVPVLTIDEHNSFETEDLITDRASQRVLIKNTFNEAIELLARRQVIHGMSSALLRNNLKEIGSRYKEQYFTQSVLPHERTVSLSGVLVKERVSEIRPEQSFIVAGQILFYGYKNQSHPLFTANELSEKKARVNHKLFARSMKAGTVKRFITFDTL